MSKQIRPETHERVVTNCCGDEAHMMLFCLDDYGWEEEPANLYISVQLNQRYGFWGRCWNALRYILGKRSRYGYGHWDEGSIDVESAVKLKYLIEEFLLLMLPDILTAESVAVGTGAILPVKPGWDTTSGEAP